jgi:hypothetical protein
VAAAAAVSPAAKLRAAAARAPVPELRRAAIMECSYHVRHSGGASNARENRPLVPTDLGQARPQVRAARDELQCSWSTAPIGLVCGSSKRRSSCRTSAVRGLPDPLRSPSDFSSYALPFYSAPGLLRVHIRVTAIRACPRTCIRGKVAREQSARKEALLVCVKVERALRASKPRLLESQDGRNTPPRPSPSACQPRALAADVQVPPTPHRAAPRFAVSYACKKREASRLLG